MLRTKTQNNAHSWQNNLLLGYLDSLSLSDAKNIGQNLLEDYELFFINYKNSIEGTGGVGTVTRSMLSVFPNLKMICYDKSLSSPKKIGNAMVQPICLGQELAYYMHALYSKLYLWPVLHNLEKKIDKIEPVRKKYIEASEKFANSSSKILKNSKKKQLIWINDYVLSGTVGFTRKIFPESKIIFSWRTPFGRNKIPKFLEEDREFIVMSVIQADVITFHREKDLHNFLLSVEIIAQSNENISIDWDNHTIMVDDRLCIPRVFPMGNDPDYRTELSISNQSKIEKEKYGEIKKGCKSIVSISRFEESKGIAKEIQAIELLLKLFPETIGKIVFIRASYLSKRKKNTPEYIEFYERITDEIDRINTKYGDENWKPIINMIDRKLNDYEVTGFFKSADIFLLMSIADGFNHLSIESILSKSKDDDPIQLLLSDIGSTDYIEGYTLLNTDDVVDCAIKIHEALNIDKNEIERRDVMLYKACKKLLATSWALSIVQSVIEIEEVPIINK